MDLMHAADICRSCPSMCESVCPAVLGSGRLDRTPRGMVLAAAVGLDEPLDHCTACGGCTRRCEAEVPVGDLLASQRARRPDRGDVGASAEAWRKVAGLRARTAVIARCGCGAPGPDADVLRAAFDQARVEGVVVLDGLDCGRRQLQRGAMNSFAALTPAIGAALQGVRSLVVPGGACNRALDRHIAEAGLVAIYTSLLDDWLARFGVELGRGAARLPCCQLGEGRAEPQTTSSAASPPGTSCCGGHGPLADVAPATAAEAARGLLARVIGSGKTELHVVDATCAAHLRAVAASEHLPIEIVARTERWLAAIAAARDAAAATATDAPSSASSERA